ncbi:MAG: hypothetical protein L0H31_00780 [Nocardioidaceae bacterium]|nr:hypothetical protein [Nocardioidaceae bacterium]
MRWSRTSAREQWATPETEKWWSLATKSASSLTSTRAVAANTLALLTWGNHADVLSLDRIVRDLGGRATAEAQERILVDIDLEPRRPLTTALVRRLGALAWNEDDAVGRSPATMLLRVNRVARSRALISDSPDGEPG